MPSKKLLSAIATTRDTNTSSTWYEATDLYVVAGMILDCYSAVKQDNDAVGEVALKEKKKNLQVLRAFVPSNAKMWWGSGGKDVAEQVYSASCYADELAGAGTWNCLMTLLADTVRISPYVNWTSRGNSILAYSEDQ